MTTIRSRTQAPGQNVQCLVKNGSDCAPSIKHQAPSIKQATSNVGDEMRSAPEVALSPAGASRHHSESSGCLADGLSRARYGRCGKSPSFRSLKYAGAFLSRLSVACQSLVPRGKSFLLRILPHPRDTHQECWAHSQMVPAAVMVGIWVRVVSLFS